MLVHHPGLGVKVDLLSRLLMIEVNQRVSKRRDHRFLSLVRHVHDVWLHVRCRQIFRAHTSSWVHTAPLKFPHWQEVIRVIPPTFSLEIMCNRQQPGVMSYIIEDEIKCFPCKFLRKNIPLPCGCERRSVIGKRVISWFWDNPPTNQMTSGRESGARGQGRAWWMGDDRGCRPYAPATNL